MVQLRKISTFFRLIVVIFWVFCITIFLLLPHITYLWDTKKSINVITWTDMIDPYIIKLFEEQTGIAVNLSYFDSNEELFIKLKATNGHGYDLVLPSDFTVESLIKENLLQPLDKSKISVWDRIDPSLLNCYYDPYNTYAIPYYCAIYGIGINQEFFEHNEQYNFFNHDKSWQLIFNKNILPYKIAMLNNPREAILITAQYLYNSIDHLDQSQINTIKNFLLQQKSWVAAYTDLRADYLLSSKTCPIVVTTTPFMNKLLQEQPQLDFIVPHNNSFIIVDNFVIPRSSTKSELVYEFINFLFQPTIIEHHFKKYTFFPATVDLINLLKVNQAHSSIIYAHEHEIKNIHFFRNVLNEHQINDVWLYIKAQ